MAENLDALHNPIQPSVEDSSILDFGRQAIGEFTRDNINEDLGSMIQPDFLNLDGKRYATGNKTFNTLNKDELNSELTSLTAGEGDESDGTLYKLRNEKTGEVKYGKTGDDVYSRYNNDAGFNRDWTVEYERPMTDINKAERLIHGNQAMRSGRANDFYAAQASTLKGGGTEVYKTDLLNDSMRAVEQLLTPQQKQLSSSLTKLNTPPKQTPPDLTNPGNLKKDSNFQAQSARVLNAFGVDISNMKPEEISQRMAEELSGFNWNIGDTSAIAYKMQDMSPAIAKDFLDTLEAYDNTDTTIQQVGRGVKELLSDPTTYVGLGSFGLGTAAAQGGKALTKKALQSLLKSKLKTQIGIGAAEGAAYSAADDALKQSVEKVADPSKDYDTTRTVKAGGVGALLGGVIGGGAEKISQKLTKHAVLPDGRQVKDTDVISGKKQPIPTKGVQEKKAEKRIVPNKVSPEDADLSAFEPKDKPEVLEKSEVKAEKKLGKDKIKTKDGKIETSPAQAEQKKVVEKGSQKVVDQRTNLGKKLDDQVEIKGDDQEFQTKIGWDARARTYDEQGNLISSQQGTAQKTSLAIQERPEVKDATKEVDRIMKMYDNDVSMQKTYGESQARLREKPQQKGKAQDLANRNQFEIDNYYELATNKAIPKAVRDDARAKAKVLQQKKITDYQYPTKVQDMIDEKLEAQASKLDSDVGYYNPNRDTVESKKVDEAYKNPEARAKAEAKAMEDKDKIFGGVEDILESLKPKYKDAVNEAERKSIAVGQRFDLEKPLPSTRDEVDVMTDVNNLLNDLDLAKEGKITPLELQSRMRSRFDDEAYRESSKKFDTAEDYDKWFKERNDLRESVGLSPLKETEFKATGTKIESNMTPEKRYQAEQNQIQQSKLNNTARVKALDKGTAKLDTLEQKMKDNGYSSADIANIMTPIGKNSEIKARRDFYVTKFTREINDKMRKKLGVTTKWRQGEVNFITPTDVTADFSNSVGQNVALIMGDLDIAKVTKVSRYSEDVRTEIARKATQFLGRDIKKDDIKPLFMTQLYGAMENSLKTAGLKGKKDLDKALKDAEELFNAYDSIMKKDYPTFHELSDAIYKLGENSQDGKFRYELPDGTPVEFDLKASQQTERKVKGKTQTVDIKEDRYDFTSRALMPNIMHSIDGYIIRQLQIRLGREGIDSRGIHDALTVRNENYDRVAEIANDIQYEIAESDILHDIMTQLGYRGQPLKKGTLDLNDVRSSLGKAMAEEHFAGKMEIAPNREFENSKLQSDYQLVQEHMLSNNINLGSPETVVSKVVTEAGYSPRKYGLAKDSDDVLERISAEAMQGRELPKIEAPKNLPPEAKRLWDEIYEDMRVETRARMEQNPMLRGIIQGKRKYFDLNGNSLKTDFKSKEQIEVEQKRLYRRILKARTRKEKQAIGRLDLGTKEVIEYVDGEIIQVPDFDKMKFALNKKETLTADELVAKTVIQESAIPLPDASKWSKYKASVARQIASSPLSKQFMRLKKFKDSAEASVAQNRSFLQKELKRTLKGVDQVQMKKVLLDTDYRTIRGMTKDEADQFMTDNRAIYIQAEYFINKNISGMRDHANRVGQYLNSPELIAKESNLPPETAPIIDKLITIRAMKNSDWDYIAKNQGSEGFELVMDVLEENLRRSKDLFTGNTEDFIKGYYKEHYAGNYKIEGGNVMWDADSKFEEGVVAMNKLNKKIGTYKDNNGKGFENREDMIAFAERDRRKVNKNGISRQVATAKIREEAGRSHDISDILLDTTASIDAKETNQKVTENISKEMDKEQLVFSREQKDDFVELTKDQRESLPYAIKDKVRWVHKDFVDMALGRIEPRLTSSDKQFNKIADRLLADVTKNFKQNVVIKNLASIKNSLAVSITLGLASGVSPLKIAKYSARAIKEMTANDKLRNKLAIAKASGKPTESIIRELKKSPLYAMEEAGLATNKVEGVVGSSSLLNSMLSKVTGGVMDGFTNNIMLNQGTKVGDALTRAFSYTDTMGRYVIAQAELDKGKSMQEAIKTADGLFGDMAQMAPALVDKLDKYGAAPFLKWFSETTPSLIKLTKENPSKVIGIAMAYYLISEGTGVSMQSANPIIAAEDYMSNMIQAPIDTYEESENKGWQATAIRRGSAYLLPATYRKAHSRLTNKREDDLHEIVFAPTMRKPKYENSLDLRNDAQKLLGGG